MLGCLYCFYLKMIDIFEIIKILSDMAGSENTKYEISKSKI